MDFTGTPDHPPVEAGYDYDGSIWISGPEIPEGHRPASVVFTYIYVAPHCFEMQPRGPMHNLQTTDAAVVRVLTPQGRLIVVRYNGDVEDSGVPVIPK